MFNTYPNKVRRLRKKFGIAPLDRMTAVKKAFAEGRCRNPTKGRKRTEVEKLKIGDGMAEHWKALPEADKEKHRDAARENYRRLTDSQLNHLKAKAKKGLGKAAKNGSKLELFLLKGLQDYGLEAIHHKTEIFLEDGQHIDIFLPLLNLAIEIDGPLHFVPILGEKVLKQHQEADAKKNSALLIAGYSVFRIMNIRKNVSPAYMRHVLARLLDVIEKNRIKLITNDNFIMEIREE